MTEPEVDLRDEIERLARTAPVDDLRAFLENTHPADVAQALTNLPELVVEQVFLCLDVDTAANVLSHMDSAQAVDVLADVVPTERLSDIVEEMEPDDAADFVGELDDEQRAELLDAMETEESESVQQLLVYDPETAGGVMTPEVVSVRETMTVDEAIEVVRQLPEHVYVSAIYVVDDEQRLVGHVRMRSLVRHPGNTPIRRIMDTDVVSVPATMDQEEVAHVVKRYDLIAVPVVGPDNVLLGQVTIDDVLDVIAEEHNEDLFKAAGSSADELSTRSPLVIARLRLPWLAITMLGGLSCSFLIRKGQLVLPEEQIFAIIAPFMPVLMGLGGNTGTQSATIVTRGLALRSFGFHDMGRVLWREVRTGVLLGLAFGLVVGSAALILQSSSAGLEQAVLLGSVVTLSMFLTIPLSCCLGTVVPMTLGRLGADPAIASGPFIAMANDILSLLVYFTLTVSLLHLFR